VLESVIAEHISSEAERLGWLPEGQHGFRRYRCAADPVLKLVHKVHRGRARGHNTVAASLDVQAAYDSVWHAGLIWQLARLPIARNLVAWLTDFLHDRRLQAKVSGSLSHVITVNVGVPQGSPLSPILYVLYTASLFAEITTPDADLYGYADDLTPSATAETTPAAAVKLQEVVNTICSWARKCPQPR
jgi:hypothetical protein